MSKLNGVEIEEKLVGFDARIKNVPAWLQERREQYLLRPEVEHPMSADEMVWPSAVDHPSQSSDQDEIGTTEFARIGRNAPLWDDLERLKQHLRDGTARQSHRLVAVSLLYGICSKGERIQWDDRLEATSPTSVAKE